MRSRRGAIVVVVTALVLAAVATVVVLVRNRRSDRMSTRDVRDWTHVTPRTLVVEVDRVTGARALPGSATRNAVTTDLKGILASIGYDIEVYIDAPVPDATHGGPFTTGDLVDLDASSANHRPTNGSDWYVHVLLVTGNAGGDLGMITDLATRRTVAVFANSATGPNELVRTTAHEIGHSLNLFHNDGDGLLSCCKGEDSTKTGLSLMNQERCLAPQWGFQWSDDEMAHLRDHPADNVRPGGCSFGNCLWPHRKKC